MRSRVLVLLFTVGLVLLAYLSGRVIDQTEIEKWVKSAGVYGPLLLILITIITGVVAPISGAPVNLVGFILYGPEAVFLFAVSGMISAIINFYIARHWGRPLVERFIGEDIKKIDEFTRDHGILSLFFMRVFLSSISDFLSYAMGLTAMKFKPYMTATIPGILVGILIWYIVALNSETPLAFLLGTLILGAAFAGVYGLYKLVKKVGSKAS